MARSDGWRGRAGRVAVVAFFSLIAVLIGMSRVYLGVHWPSDVLAGWCFGTAWALLVWMGDRWLGRRRGSQSGSTFQKIPHRSGDVAPKATEGEDGDSLTVVLPPPTGCTCHLLLAGED